MKKKEESPVPIIAPVTAPTTGGGAALDNLLLLDIPSVNVATEMKFDVSPESEEAFKR